MIINIYIGPEVSHRSFYKKIRKYFGVKMNKKKYYRVIAPKNSDYTLSFFEKYIRLNTGNSDLSYNIIKYMQNFISNEFANTTVGIYTHDFEQFVANIQNVTLINLGEHTYGNDVYKRQKSTKICNN